jgi:hypothetical protein
VPPDGVLLVHCRLDVVMVSWRELVVEEVDWRVWRC